jgi:alanyl-tRNA synthetase
MKSHQIREKFLKYFQERDHKIYPSSSLIPKDDPTLLFANAGMNQFKDVILGRKKPEHKRTASCQKCIRVSGKHNDLEEVGKDTTHHTFFEMLGNWSFGDYFKKDAIIYAWEFLTEICKLSKDKLWVSVFREDDEAEKLWYKHTDIQKEGSSGSTRKITSGRWGKWGPAVPAPKSITIKGKSTNAIAPTAG